MRSNRMNTITERNKILTQAVRKAATKFAKSQPENKLTQTETKHLPT